MNQLFNTRCARFAPALFFVAVAGCHEYEPGHRDRVIIEERREIRTDQRRDRVIITEGRHLLEFRAPRRGIATVVDLDNGREIITTDLDGGDRLTFDADRNKVYVNDRKIYDHDINSKHLYRLYFDERR